ncbi:SGNH/GDSL hydrolase family protein [Niallia sp. Krafla_26]|uniref:SGNH/GDSL hydrolase family protein n=1 Tax=Niallia sp. Krafla_26 TaxID=3064703 RepID=UPI003D177DC7
MNKIIAILSVIACMTILVAGQLHWNNKTTVSVASEKVSNEETTTTATEEIAEVSIENLLSYTSNWPTESVETFEELISSGKPFHLAFLGSNTQGNSTEPWSELVKEALKETYGEQIIVSTFSYDLTSTQFVNEDKLSEIIGVQPHMVIFEPFTLKDNGEVTTEDSLKNTASVIEDLQESLPNTVVILQPSHPLYNVTYYPKEVEALADFAAENGIPYLSHWEAWPDPASEEMKEYITANPSEPTAQGHQLWAGYLIDYLIAE